MSGDLVARLTRALDEDECLAKAAIQSPWRDGTMAPHLVDGVVYGRSPYAYPGPHGDKIVQVANLEMAWEGEANKAHIIRQQPDRTLRMVAAHRRILELHRRAHDNVADRLGFAAPDMCAVDAGTWPCETVRALAEAYGLATEGER